MAIMNWLVTLGSARATANAADALAARQRAEAQVDAVARRVAARVRTAA